MLKRPNPSTRRAAQHSLQGWHQEAALRCLMNNLDPVVAERPDELIVTAAAKGGTELAATTPSSGN